ncbi:MAG: ArnT family glycosyltransferase [Anaerolineae bacterium]
MINVWRKRRAHLEYLFVILLAGSVRLTSLGAFRAIDEEDRWAWGVDFFRALLDGILPGTLVGDGYPGIFPAWLETVWLLAASLYRSARAGGWIGDGGVYALIHDWGRVTNLPLQRLPVALANTLLVVAIFWYCRRLFGRRTALLAAVFISLDPFVLSDSRVNRAEALLAGLMTLSLLALVASLRESSRKQLAASAVWGGLAWLTKLQALVLLPVFGATSLLWLWRAEGTRQAWPGRWAAMMAGWTLLAAATFVLFWPAAWTVPGPTFSLMWQFLTRKTGEEGVLLFFMGRLVVDKDPGLLFYPITFLLRITPLALAGLALGAWLWGRRIARARFDVKRWADEAGLWALALYALLYVAGMSLGSHKQDRFLMSIFPPLDILAAAAFVSLAARQKWPGRRQAAAAGLLLALQLATALPFHPYYFSYFNPLVGGGPVAARVTRIGWGEGMDRVAAYLSALDNPRSLTVAARYYKYLLGYPGKAVNLDASGEWLHAGKIIFYIQQVQRMLDPSPGVIRYFQQHVPPEKTIVINGIEYAQIYPNPIAYPADPQADRLAGQFALLGYRWEKGPGGATLTLVWENLAQPPASAAARLAASASEAGDWLPCRPAPGFEQAAQTPGEVVESVCVLPAAGLSPGMYSLQIAAGGQTLDFAAGWSAVRVTADGAMERVEPETAFAQLAEAALPSDAPRLEHTYAYKIRLLGYTLSSDEVRPGQTLAVTLYWQAVQPVRAAAHVSVQAFAGDRQLANTNGPPLGGRRPTDSWRPGEVISDVWQIPLPPDAPAPALVSVGVGLFNPDTVVPWQVRNRAGVDIPNAIAAARLLPERWPVYSGSHPLDFRFGDVIRLTGFERVTQGDALEVTLYWVSEGPAEEDYTAFVHLLGPDGGLATQSDAPPEDGLYPTSAWRAGEVALSRHRLSLPPGLPPGRYTLLAGLYRPGDGARPVATAGDGSPLPGNAAPLGSLDLP